jgi:chromate transport protein ChrA
VASTTTYYVNKKSGLALGIFNLDWILSLSRTLSTPSWREIQTLLLLPLLLLLLLLLLLRGWSRFRTTKKIISSLVDNITVVVALSYVYSMYKYEQKRRIDTLGDIPCPFLLCVSAENKYGVFPRRTKAGLCGFWNRRLNHALYTHPDKHSHQQRQPSSIY